MRKLVLLAGIASFACTRQPAPEGQWRSTSPVFDNSVEFTLDQTGDLVHGSGSYTFEGGGPTGALQVEGSYDPPVVRLTLVYDFGRREVFTGQVEDTVMVGSLHLGPPDMLPPDYRETFIRRR